MKATYWQRGESLDYLNSGDAVIEANSVITLGTRIGVAGTNINPGEVGSVHVVGVFVMEKTGTEAIELGAAVYFDGNGITGTEGGTPAGYAVAAATAEAKEIYVKLLG